MKINNLREYIASFFDNLTLTADMTGDHAYKSYIVGAINEFIDNETKETAFGVYQTFFDIYRVVNEDVKNPFIDLLDTLRNYEEKASTLTDKQRDHYIHSVNVFILGIAIFTQNSRYNEAFKQSIEDFSTEPWMHKGNNEEFLYRWGIASLFHDIGYPAEITIKQVGKFLEFITSVDTAKPPVAHIGFDDFKKIDSIPEILNKEEFTSEFKSRYPETKSLNLLEPTDLLSYKLHQSYQIDLNTSIKALDDYIYEQSDKGLADHGFYSSLIVLKWYGSMIQRAKMNPGILYYQITDCATAILLHNYYKNYFCTGKKFNHGPMQLEEYPLAWLLILSDELQEWNREAYGILDKKKVLAADVSLFIEDEQMAVTYIASSGKMKDNFGDEKEADLRKLLQIDDVFPKGFNIGCESMDNLGNLVGEIVHSDVMLPRPLMENIEKLAIAIHDMYNSEQLKKNPNIKLEYPKFSDLPDTLKYSNIRQARDITKKLKMIGCIMQPIGTKGHVISEIPKEDVEFLAKLEHDLWMNERIQSGWTYGEIKDPVKKISPYLIPYQELTDSIKQLDRDTINNIPKLLKLIGMAIYSID